MAFTCDFVRHDCTHTELFHSSYQRTNRTKGSKILRCFPHCCPDHVTRSFCGAPLYLDVQWRPLQPPHGLRYPPQGLRDDVPVLLVFGRFRLQQEPGFAVGERLTADAITHSVQSDENPNGQWIKSALVQRPASMDDTLPWRFEINSSARWFYGWESGVAKSHRLREHVLDVLVTTPEPPSGASPAWLRVVATAQSPPFKMISFRRATPEALSLLSASSAPKAPLPIAHAKPPVDLTRKNRHHTTGNARIKEEMDPEEDEDSDRVPGRLARRLPTETQPVLRPPVAHTADPLAQLRDLAVVWSFIERIPLRHVLPLAPAMERVFWNKLDQKNGSRCLRQRHQQQETSADETLIHLLGFIGDDDRRRTSPGPVLKIAAHVALWLWWDDALHVQWRELVDDAAAVLMDGPVLRGRFERRVVRWLWERLDAFLKSTDWTLGALVAAIASSSHVPADAETFAVAYEAFVAHVRERFVDQQRHAHHHAKRRRLVHPARSLALADGATPESIFDGEWLATLDDLHADPGPQGYGDMGSTTPWRLIHLLWFWREFSALRIQFDASNATLRVRSLVGHHADDNDRDERGESNADDPPPLAFVLDHRCRWARHLPSGASTLAVPLADSLVGDYVGKVSPSGREIHLNCYAWPASAPPEADGMSLWASCFQVHLRVASPDALQVRVTVNRGRIDPRPLGLDRRASAAAVAREIRSRPLGHKLTMVPQWRPSGEWLWEYARVAA